MGIWSISAILLPLLCLSGCADGAKLVQENDRGGIVVYPIKGEQSAVLSPFRKEALVLMQQKCGGPYGIVREGESRGRSRMTGSVGGTQEVIRERRWGIQFECK